MLLKEFEAIGDIFIKGFIEPTYNKYLNREKDWREGLRLFLHSAYERQGRSPNYSPIAVDTIKECCKNENCIILNKKLPYEIWETFEQQLKTVISKNKKTDPANTKANPLAPSNTKYKKNKKGDIGETNYSSVIEFIKNSLKNHDYNIYLFVKKGIKDNRIKATHSKLKEINGIAEKIASLFMRDVAVYERIDVKDSDDRELLQPVDVWVRRCYFEIDEPLKSPEKSSEGINYNYAKSIIESCYKESLSPEKVNMGMWYVSTQICDSSYYHLKNLLNYEKEKEKIIKEHLNFINQIFLAEKKCYQNLL